MNTLLRAASRFAFYCSAVLLMIPIANANPPSGEVLYTIDFSQQADGSALKWLKQNGFVFGLDAEKLNPRFENHQLVISTDAELAGIMGVKIDENSKLRDVTRVEIEWGVSRFPEGANWERENNRVALAVMIFFGTEKLSSGLPFGVNAAPYFLSPFVGKAEPPGKTYIGALYKKGGRYFSVAPPASAGLFTTDFEVRERFKEVFKKQNVPMVSGVAFQMNTKDTKGGAVASIRRISLIGR